MKDRANLFHRRAFAIAMVVGAIAAILQPISGDISARYVARYQPAKLAAMEGQWETERGAPLRIGGWPDEKTETTRFSLEIPYALSLLSFHDPKAEITGLKAFPKENRPPVAIVHIAFQIMIACGSAMLLVGLIFLWKWWRKRTMPDDKWLLWATVLCGPLGFIAIEAGWTVTEVGRQPWIIYNVMRTKDAVTPMPGLVVPFLSFTILYFFLAIIVIYLLKRQVFQSPRITEPLVNPNERQA